MHVVLLAALFLAPLGALLVGLLGPWTGARRAAHVRRVLVAAALLAFVPLAGGGAPLFGPDARRGIPGDVWRSFYHYVGCRVQGRSIRAHAVDEAGDEDPKLAFTVCEHP